MTDADRWLDMYKRGMTHEQISLEENVGVKKVGEGLRAHPDYIPRPARGNSSSKMHGAYKPVDEISSIPKAGRGRHPTHRRRGRL